MKLFFAEFKFKNESIPIGRMITCESEEKAKQMVLEHEKKRVNLNELKVMEIKVVEDVFGDIIYNQ